MRKSAQLFDCLTDEYKARKDGEAIIDFTVSGVDFTLTVSGGVMILWFDDEGQTEELFSNERQDRERLINWLERAIGEAIQ